MQGDCLAPLVVWQNVQDRREGFLAHVVGLPIELNQSRFYIEGLRLVVCQDTFAASDHGAGGARTIERGVHRGEGRLVDQRPDQCPGFSRVADLD